jgi:glycosyltransferase involved in cell wall biosynthesis
MTWGSIAATVFVTGVLTAWLRYAWIFRRITAAPSLAAIAPAPPAGMAWPRLSVVVACRNEEAAVRTAMASLLAQDYPGLEVVAVDDRSEDATGAILDELAGGNPALRVAHVRALPDGWLGKTHALQQGAAAATGAWLLFTDADVVFAPDALRRAVAWAVRDRLGHAVALPHFVAPGFLERSFVSLFGLLLLLHLRIDRLTRAGSEAYIGVGAFNLVARDAYERIGGHRAVRFEVADDTKLGLVLRRSGVRQGCADSAGLVRVRWQRGFAATMRGLVKNFFAGNEYRWGNTLRTALLVPAAVVGPLLVLAFAPQGATRLLAAAALAVPVVMVGASARWLAGGRGHEGLLLPMVSVCVSVVAFASALSATVRGAVIWRGTRYPLPALKAACVREHDWPRDRAPAVTFNEPVADALPVTRRERSPS